MSVLSHTKRGLTMALLVAVLTGCTVGWSDPPGESRTPQLATPPTSTPPIPGEDGALRQRLVDGLSPTEPSRARLVDTAELTVIATPWLSGWQIVDVVNSTLAHPQRFYLALSADGAVVNLTGQPGNFNRVISEARPRVESATVATDLAATFLDSTRDFVKYSYRIDGVDDITWLPQLDESAKQVRSRVEQAYGSKVTPPRADQVEGAWRFSVWMVNGNRLVRHDLQAARNGVLSDTPQTVFEGLPVPDSI